MTNRNAHALLGLFFLCISAHSQPIIETPPEQNGYELSKLFKEVSDKHCLPETFTTVYRQCRSPSCGYEIINQTPFNFTVDSGGASCGLQSQSACDLKVSEYHSKKVVQCSMSCTGNKFKGFSVYHSWNYQGTMGDSVAAVCRAETCGIEKTEPATFKQCRHIFHEVDENAIIKAMQTGDDADRAAGILVEVIRRTNGLQQTLLKAIESAAKKNTANRADLARRLDRIRKLLEVRGGNTTEAEVAEAAEERDFKNSTQSSQQKASLVRLSALTDGAKKPNISTKVKGRAIKTFDFLPARPSLYQGVDYTTGETKGSCVEKPIVDPKPITKKDLWFSVRRLDDYQALSRYLYGDASVSAVGYGGAEAQFARTFSSSRESIHLVVDISVTVQERNGVPEVLKKPWEEKLKSDPRGFFRACGDKYVSSEKLGSRFTAIFTVYASSAEESETLKASLSGGVVGSWTVGASFESAMKKIAKLKEVNVYIHSKGYPGGKTPDTAEGIIEYAKDFADKVNTNNASTLDVMLLGYETLINFTAPNPFVTQQQLGYLRRADAALRRSNSLLSTIAFIRAQPTRFDWGNLKPHDLDKAESIVFQDEQKTYELAANCYLKQDCAGQIPNSIEVVKLPQPKPKKIYTGGCSLGNLRFANFNGGCLDQSTLVVWSSISSQNLNYAEAKSRCNLLSENQTTAGNWSLPSVFDFLELVGAGAGRTGLVEGLRLDDSFWAHDGSAEKSARWVNGANGNIISQPNQELKFLAICVQN